MAVPQEDPAALLQSALLLHSQGRLAETISAYQLVLDASPAQPDALHLQGVALSQSGQPGLGAQQIRKSLAINPSQPVAWANLGIAELALAHPEEALRCYDQSLMLSNQHALAHNGRGNALIALERFEEALHSFDRAIDLDPNLGVAVRNRGLALLQLGRFAEAVAALDEALKLQPNAIPAWIGRGRANCELHRYEQALADADRALIISPGNLDARYLRCLSLLQLGQFAPLLAATGYLQGRPDEDPQLAYYAGAALTKLGRPTDAADAFEQALELRKDFPEALFELGMLSLSLHRFERAAAAFDRLFDLAAGSDFARGSRLHARLQICDWRDYEVEVQAIAAAIDAGINADLPLSFMAISDDPARQYSCARALAATLPNPAALVTPRRTGPHKRIRLGYVSADFVEHPVAHLLSGVIELHDRERFEPIAIALRTDERSPAGIRLKSAFEQFFDMTGRSDEAIAGLLRELQIDIAVDLMGYTAGARPGIFARKPAPVQVGYLGYPGTLGAAYLDYLIADAVVIPPAEEQCYAERVVRLASCYLPTSFKRESGTAPTRQQAGLPAEGLVLCAFTHGYKINPPLFDIWARVLRATPGSMLWVRAMGKTGQANLRSEAERRGLEPERLIFAEHLPSMAAHLARLQLADLCLDTFPYNSHSTACDALWAGVPVLTCTGRAMASRVAASALTSVGMEDLIARDLGEYQAKALELTGAPELLQPLRTRLERQRRSAPLFDTVTYTRALEEALLAIHRSSQAV